MSTYPNDSPLPDPCEQRQPDPHHTSDPPPAREPRWKLALGAVVCVTLGYTAWLVVGWPERSDDLINEYVSLALEDEYAGLALGDEHRARTAAVSRCVAERTIERVGKSEFRWMLDHHFSLVAADPSRDVWGELWNLLEARKDGESRTAVLVARSGCRRDVHQ